MAQIIFPDASSTAQAEKIILRDSRQVSRHRWHRSSFQTPITAQMAQMIPQTEALRHRWHRSPLHNTNGADHPSRHKFRGTNGTNRSSAAQMAHINFADASSRHNWHRSSFQAQALRHRCCRSFYAISTAQIAQIIVPRNKLRGTDGTHHLSRHKHHGTDGTDHTLRDKLFGTNGIEIILYAQALWHRCK